METSKPRNPGPQGPAAEPLSRRQVIAGAGKGALGVAALSALGGLGMPAIARAAGNHGYGKRSYKIGYLGPDTGPFSPEGGSLKRGTELGLEVINKAGGIAGHPIQMLKQDTASSAVKAATIAKKYLQRDKVDMLFGTIAFDEENVVNKLATSAKVPFVTLEAGPWVPWCGGPTVILGETSQQLLEPLIPFMSKKFGKKWALVGSDFGFPREYFKVAKKIMAKEGVQVLTEQYGPLGTTDWSSVIGKLKAVEPDVILGGVVGGDSIAFVKAAASLGLIPKAQLTGVTLQAEFYPAMGHAIDGLYSSVRYTEELQTPENEQLKKLYKAKYGNVPVPLVATTAYYSFNFIKAAIEQAKSFDPEAVIAAFRSGKVKAQTVVSDQPLSVDAASLAVNYPMYICQIKPGGVWSIVDKAGVVPPGISC